MRLRVLLVHLAMLVALFALSVRQVKADVLDTPLPAVVATGTFGGMHYERFGSGNPALILVPGLGSGPWVWADTIAREAKTHTVYVVTLAGFDGTPLVPHSGLDAADAQLLSLITTEKLDRPVLIGHSLGGFLALRFGTEHSDLLRGDASVDGLPVFPELAQSTAEQRTAYADRFAAAISGATKEQYEAEESQVVRDDVTDPALAARVTSLTDRSDRSAMALYSKDLFARDLRPALGKLTVPTLVIAPVPGLPLPSYLPADMATMSLAQRRSAIVGFYQSIMAGAPSVTVVPIDNSRHFVMLDQPEAFAKALDYFLQTLK